MSTKEIKILHSGIFARATIKYVSTHDFGKKESISCFTFTKKGDFE